MVLFSRTCFLSTFTLFQFSGLLASSFLITSLFKVLPSGIGPWVFTVLQFDIRLSFKALQFDIGLLGPFIVLLLLSSGHLGPFIVLQFDIGLLGPFIVFLLSAGHPM